MEASVNILVLEDDSGLLRALEDSLRRAIDPLDLVDQRPARSNEMPNGRWIAGKVGRHDALVLDYHVSERQSSGGRDKRTESLIAEIRGRFLDSRAGLPLALRHAIQVSPDATPSDLARAVLRASVSPLGKAISTVTSPSTRVGRIAQEALSALITLELPQEKPNSRLENSSRLVDVVAKLREASNKPGSRDEFESSLAQAITSITDNLASSLATTRGSNLDLSFIISLVSLVLSILAIWLSFEQLELSARAEVRAQRQEREAANAEMAGTVRAQSLQESIDRLVGLQTNLSERSRSGTTAGRLPRPNVEWEVMRAVVLRETDNHRSKRVIALGAGDVVEVIAKAGQSVQVKYTNPLSDAVQIGWLRKKYIRRVAE